jgi:hypothetical protein
MPPSLATVINAVAMVAELVTPGIENILAMAVAVWLVETVMGSTAVEAVSVLKK